MLSVTLVTCLAMFLVVVGLVAEVMGRATKALIFVKI